MALVRPWLVLGLAALSCSSRSTGEATRQEPPAHAALSAGSAAAVASAPPDDRYDTGSLGAVRFEVTQGTREARDHFTRGLLAMHSFWYDEAVRQFDAAIAADRTMAMAYWGAAMSRCQLLWGDDDLDGARDALSRMPASERLSLREKAWVTAAIELVREGDVRTSRRRFLDQMENIHARFPDDESATFLAAALLASTRPEDPDTVAVRKRAAALAAGVFEHNPKHPGAAHYLIHAYDTPELASLALPYARAYAQIAPAAFHARHMPAHIFSRLGMWKEAIASCQSAWDASVAAARSGKLSANHHDFHSLNWLVEMSFELGHRKAADSALGVFGAAVRDGLAHQHRALYATEVASYMMRTGEWKRVDELLAPLETPAADDADPAAAAPPVEPERAGEPHHCGPIPASSPTALLEQRTTLGTRARAAAMRRDAAATARYLREADAVSAALRPFLLSMQPREAVERLEAAAARRRRELVARAAGDDRAVLDVLRQSVVDDQESTGGEANPSGFVLHEEIADTLMRLGRPKDAAAEYALVLENHPARAHALLGAARAAARAGAAGDARRGYRQLLELWSSAEPGVDGLAEAKAAVAGK
jgi:tetratricopeptide (TPR) repeat protein